MNFILELCDDFLSLIFPRICYGCGNHLMRGENILCTECYILIPRSDYHVKEKNPVAELFWGRCKVEKAAAFSYFNRGSRIRRLIHNLKYNGIKEIGYELGKIYGTSLNSSGFLDDIDIIIPVPLHPSKKRIRGFNQSEIICEGMAEACGKPVETSALIRIKSTSTQTKRSRYERWTNVEGIFSVTDPQLIMGKHILLVDDVITTGSTIESCVNELNKTEGVAVSVAALAFAVI